jgi:cytochrome c-type biogenesis protein CcmH/NrfG
MSKEENVDVHAACVKKTTAALAAVICLAAGFFIGLIYSNLGSGGSGGSDRVRKMTVKQTETQAPAANQVQQSSFISVLEQKVAADPRDAGSWLKLGHAYFDINRHADAINAYKEYLELKPGSADVWTDMGVMHRRGGNPQEALRCFEQAIALDPKHRQSRFNKGVVLIHDLKDTEGAIKAWEELLKIHPDAKTPSGQPLEQLIKAFKEKSF